jgi:hypothetical protein
MMRELATVFFSLLAFGAFGVVARELIVDQAAFRRAMRGGDDGDE